MKIIELHKVSELEIFPIEIQLFSNALSFTLNGRIISFSLKGFVFEKNLNSRRSESKYESLGKSFYSLSFNFQKVSNSLTSGQQTINQIYLFIITFQNLEFWDVTNLPPLK